MGDPKSAGQITPISSYSINVVARNAPTIAGAGPNAWFGPLQPLPPLAPPGVGGRQFDYPFGANLQYIPRGDSSITFGMLRSLADNLPELRIVIEKRKDQIAGWQWDIQGRLLGKDRRKQASKDDPRLAVVRSFMTRPDRRQSFHSWLRMLLEDMLVIDAATIYPRMTRGGNLYSLDIIDGSSIKPLIDESGRQPLPDEGPAYQQILHGIPAADFTLDELLYLPRNRRSHRLYGLSPVEQILITINTAIRRSVYNLEYYNSGTLPDGFATLPKEWTTDQIKQFQDWFDGILSGNLADRRKLRFVPSGFDFVGVKQPPLKDNYDEWLMRIICSAFSISPSPWVEQINRATAQTILLTTAQEGIRPLKNWVKDFMDDIIQRYFGFDDLEFTWSGDDEIDPLEKAQETEILIGCGVKTREEARVEYGLDPFTPDSRSPQSTAPAGTSEEAAGAPDAPH